MLNREYLDATKGSLGRAMRYPSGYVYRDYLSFLHAFGEHDAAWAGFSQVQSSFDVPQVWLSALVGHRTQGLGDGAVRTLAQESRNS
jgi:hypothetical protein